MKRGRSGERTAYNAAREGGLDRAALHAAVTEVEAPAPPRRGRAPRAAAVGDDGRWVPIGPSVIRRGQAVDRPHVVGRIRDLAVSPDGRRAYAASAKGGLWYTENAGATWTPVGAWIGGHRRAGGNTSVFVCGALLVEFGGGQASDVVMVGTGELVPFFTSSGSGRVGGVGVLTARGPAFALETDNPWEPDTGIDRLEGVGVFRLVRRPGRIAGSVVAGSPDEVLAATSTGLFRGVRGNLPAAAENPPFPALAAREGFVWTPVAGIPAGTQVTDVLWIPNGAATRIVVLVDGQGVRFSDDDGATFVPVPTLHRPAVPVTGRSSIAVADGNRAYVLYDRGAGPAVARIADLTATPPVATALTGVPTVWTNGGARDYDQAIAAESVGGSDRLYLGGNTTKPTPTAEFGASLWAMDVVGTALQPRAGVSNTGLPPAAGADQPGLVGNNVHADVHAIRLPGASAARRPVWVACDGGVYVSVETGQVNTFASMNIGLAVSETGFIDHHPGVSHFLATGLQDNGTSVRTGDTVWEAIHVGDGGGLAFAPTSPSTLVAQYIRGWWRSQDANFRDPLTRNALGPNGTITTHAEYTGRAEFYSACAAVLRPGVGANPPTTRFALGTDRVHLSDTVGSGAATTWSVLPVTPSAAPPGTTAAAADHFPWPTPLTAAFGVVGGGFGNVISLAWVSPTELVVLYRSGILRQTEVTPGNWHTDRLVDPAAPPAAFAGGARFTEVAAVPGTRDFYVTTMGAAGSATPDTAYVFDAATSTFHATGLRRRLPPAPLGPLDPAYSVVVDPASTIHVYVGTATGVWRGTRTNATGGHTWDPFVNGLPEATVQDLSIWTDPGGGASPRLLRAAVQSRGVWETDLAAATPVTTYLRGHPFDDRRGGPVVTTDPRAPLTALSVLSSPDVVVRPAWPVASAPAFPQVQVGVPDAPLTSANASAFHTWTFQTAFRWWYPNVRADGQWTDAFGDLIAHDRRTRGMPAGRTITKALWDAVVGATRLRTDASGHLVRSTDVLDDLAVFRPPWQTSLAPDLTATEVDIMECVVPPAAFAGLWSVPGRPSVVEVLLHHRASAPTTPLTSSAGLMWKEVTVGSIPLTEPAQPFVDWWASASDVPEGSVAAPPGWTVVRGSPLTACHVLDESLDARLPRSVPVPVDLTAAAGKVVLLVAFASSIADGGLRPAPAAPATLARLLLEWPHVAARLVYVATP